MWTAQAALPAFSSMKKTSAQPYLLEDWKPCLKINPERNSLENSGPKTFFHPEFTLQLQRKSISFDFKQCILSNSQILSLTKPSNVVLDQVLPLEIVSFTWYNPRQKSWHICPLLQHLSGKFISSLSSSPDSMLFIVMNSSLLISNIVWGGRGIPISDVITECFQKSLSMDFRALLSRTSWIVAIGKLVFLYP